MESLAAVILKAPASQSWMRGGGLIVAARTMFPGFYPTLQTTNRMHQGKEPSMSPISGILYVRELEPLRLSYAYHKGRAIRYLLRIFFMQRTAGISYRSVNWWNAGWRSRLNPEWYVIYLRFEFLWELQGCRIAYSFSICNQEITRMKDQVARKVSSLKQRRIIRITDGVTSYSIDDWVILVMIRSGL